MTNNELRENTKKWPGLRDANTGKDCSDIELVNGIYLSAGIPRSMVDLCFPNKSQKGQKDALWPLNMEQLEICNIMYEMAMNREPKTLIVTGGNGTGKSYLGAALIHSLIKYLVCDTARYVNEGELLLRSQSFEGNWFHQYTEICKFLVIDEFGMTQWSPTDKRKIELILNTRYGKGYPTVLLTNRTPGELFDTTGGKEPILSAQLRSRYASGERKRLTGYDMRRYKPQQVAGAPDWMLHSDDEADLPF